MMDTKILIRDLVKKNGNERKDLLPVLQGVVAEEKYLSAESMREIARQFDISSADVYGTASFYSFLGTKPRGRHIIRVCKTIMCDMKNKSEIVHAIEDYLHINMGETTADKEFSLLEANCLGSCHMGPAMLIDDDLYTQLTPIKAKEILRNYKLDSSDIKNQEQS